MVPIQEIANPTRLLSGLQHDSEQVYFSDLVVALQQADPSLSYLAATRLVNREIAENRIVQDGQKVYLP